MTKHTLPGALIFAVALLAAYPAAAIDMTASRPDVAAPAAAAAENFAAPATPAADEARQWLAVDGETVQRAVKRWAESAGWQLQWQARHIDYAVVGGLQFSGTFTEAIESLAFAYAGAQRPLKFKFWEGNKVLVVTEK